MPNVRREETLIFHRLQVAECELLMQEGYSLADQRMSKASKVAYEVDHVVPHLRRLMNAGPASCLSQMKARRELSELRKLLSIHAAVGQHILPFVQEHAALCTEGTRELFERYYDWLPGRVNEFESHVQGFNDAMEQAIADDCEEIRRVNDEWAVTECDGLGG